MRNLKRALSLALAAIMVLGLMVVGASAASTYDNFTDKDEIVNTEAVNTMVSLGVLAGKDDGSYFDPTGIVTRGEMAKIVAVCLNGGKEPVLGDSTNIPKFSDVPSTHWAYNYVAYCVQQGIIAGRGDGTFAPDEPVTGSAAAKMFLCALGYRADLEGLTGNEWELNTNILANQDAKLYEGLGSINASQGLSRDNTAQMAYNAVQAQEVTYNNLFGDYTGVLQTEKKGTMLQNRFGVVKVEGIVVANEIFGLSDYSATPSGKSRFIDCNSYTVVDANGNRVTKSYDNVYPVSIPNEYVGQRVVIYVKFPNALAPNAADCEIIGEPILSSKNTVATTGSKLKDDDAVKSFLRENDLTVGAEQMQNGNANTNRGVLTVANNVFTFAKGDVTLANGINARGTKITFIDNTGDGTVDYILKETKHLAKVTVYNEDKSELTLAGVGNINFKDIANEEDVAAGDIVLYVKYDNTYYFSKPETVTGTFSAYNADATTMIMDDVSYADTSVGFNAASTDLLPYTISKDEIGNTYTLYLDDFGNVIAVELADEALGNYALVLGTTTTGSSSVLNKGEVKLLLSDGTTATYTVNLAASGARFGWSSLSNNAKEANMKTLLTEKNGTSPLTNTIVTYIVGEDGTVTLGNPGLESAYDMVYNQTGVGKVKSTQTSYNFPNTTSYMDGAGVTGYLGDVLLAKDYPNGMNVVLNDSTLFFFRDDANNDKVDPVVVQGLKNLPAGGIDNSELKSVVYRTDSTGTRVAKAVYVDAAYKGAVNYLYLVSDYTATRTSSTGERIFTYPVVFEDGTAGTIQVREAYATNLSSGKVYAYTTDGSYYRPASAEISANETGSGNSLNSQGTGIANVTVNGYVVIHSQADSITMQWGLNNNSSTNGGYADKSFKVNSSTKVINVEDGAKPYESKLSANSTVALATDSDGFVRVAFVKDSNVSFRQVFNNTNKDLTSSKVVAAGVTPNIATLTKGSSIFVASGFNFYMDAAKDSVVTYSKTTDGGVVTSGLTVKGNSNGYASIEMPAYATLSIGGEGGSTGPDATGDLTINSKPEDVSEALKNGNVTLEGDYTPASGQLVVPKNSTMTIKGNYTPKDADSVAGTLIVTGEYNVGSNGVSTTGTVEVGTLKSTGDVTVSSGTLTINDNNGLDITGSQKKLTVGENGTLIANGNITLPGGSVIKGTVDTASGKTVSATSGTITLEGAAIEGTVDLSNATTTAFAGDTILSDGATLTITGRSASSGASLTVNSGATLIDKSDAACPTNLTETIHYGANVICDGSWKAAWIVSDPSQVDTDTYPIYFQLFSGSVTVKLNDVTFHGRVQLGQDVTTVAADKYTVAAGATLDLNKHKLAANGTGAGSIVIENGAIVEGYEGDAQNFYDDQGTKITNPSDLAGKTFKWNTTLGTGSDQGWKAEAAQP